jgi:tRNA 2-selenouridine synthase
MRSAAIAWLLSLYGFKVAVLERGYKAYRNNILETFSLPLNLKVIAGFTGSGKTEILQELQQKGKAIIDLEKLASHKGSAFGNINMPEQPKQEMFENLLAEKLWAMGNEQWAIDNLQSAMDNSQSAIEKINSPFPIHHSPIWIEDESQRIGLINIPPAFWQQIRQAPVYFFDIPFEERLKHIVEEYGAHNKKLLAESITRISKRLGGLETKNALNYLEEGNISACFSILLKYYDKHYSKGLHNRDNLSSLLQKLPCIAVDPNNAAMLTTQSISV